MSVVLLQLHYVFATDYYFSQSSGNDAGLGTPASPFKSLTKAQTLATTGNRLFFQRGDTWYGSLVIQGSGTLANPVFIGAYGTGAKPIITGFTLISAWDAPVSNVYTSTSSASSLSTCNIASINGVNYSKARLPKTGYYNITATNGSTTITNSNISTSVISPNNGSQVVVRELMYELNNHNVTNVSGNTVTFDAGSIAANWGFILMNDIKMCTQVNEWVYNTSTKKISVYATSTPTNVQVPTIEVGINCNNKNNITIDNINISGYNSTGINTTSQSNIKITNCDFSFIGVDGIYGYPNSLNLQVLNSTFTDCGSRAIHGGSSSNGLFSNNTLLRIGHLQGMGTNGDNSYTGIVSDGDNSEVSYNNIQYIGYNGIHWDGNATLIKANYINTTTYNKDDGGGIYCFPVQCSPPNGSAQCPQTTRTVRDNIVLNSKSAPAGSPYGNNGCGIYLDGQSPNTNVIHNFVANDNNVTTGFLGIFNNGGNYNVYDSNTTWNWQIGYYLTKVNAPINNITSTNNIWVAGTPNVSCGLGQYAAEYLPGASSMPSTFSASNNVYARPLNQTQGWIFYNFGSNSCATLSQWQSLTSKDAGSTSSPKIVNSIDSIIYVYNNTAGYQTTALGQNYIDFRNNSYPGSITLPPYSGAVLIKNGGIANTPPTCSAGTTPVSITLPTNTVSLTGTGASTMGGTIVSYLWEKTVGGTATIANANSASTTATGLTTGSYTFRITVTDNNGLTCQSSKSVTVNPQPVTPTVNAGTDQTITLPTNNVSLSGSATGGSGFTYKWSVISGIGGTLSAPTSANTNLTGLVAGIYLIKLDVTNSLSLTGYDTVQVTVNPAVVLPTANAGSNISITLPTNSCSLVGIGTGTATPLSYLWTILTGSGGNLSTPTSTSTQFTSLIAGVYTVEYKVTDNIGNIARDTVQVTVNSAPISLPPVVTCIPNFTSYLPFNTFTIQASVMVPSGTLSSFSWTALDGGTVTTPTQLTSTVSGITTAGTYRFVATATSSVPLTGKDTLTVTVQEFTPIKGIRFLSASLNKQKNAIISWSADVTQDGGVFEVQHKKRTGYQTVSTIKAYASVTDYKITAAIPTGINYFQLKYTTNKYSSVVSVKKN